MDTSKCLKEWNATIEALGNGKQTILIRNYNTNVNAFLLYPTVSYASNDKYIGSFQKTYKKFVEQNLLPQKKGKKVLIKYYATVEDVIEKPVVRIPSDKYYIWTRDHVKNFMSGEKAFIWVLRIYTLKEPYWAEPTLGAVKFVNLKEKVYLDGIKPVLTDIEFSEIMKKLIGKKR